MPSKDFLPGIGAAVDFGFDQLSGAINFKRQRRMLDHMNRYNAPKAQMQRLEEAGINPHAILGNTSGGGQSANLPSVSSAPNTSRYQDARVKSAQTDLVQKQADIATQKLEQERITTRIKKQIFSVMSAHPIQSIQSLNAETGEINFSDTPSEYSRYQGEALAKYQMTLDDTQIKAVDRAIRQEIGWEEALTSLGMSKEKLKSLKNNNRLWDAIDGMVKGSPNPYETLSMIVKILLATGGAKTN